MEIQEAVNAVPECLRRLRAEGNDVILYGAGYCGHETIALMRAYDIPIRAVCDDFRAGASLDGYEIIRLEDARPAENTVVFITSGYYAKMKEHLASLGLLPYYRAVDFGRYDAEKENATYFRTHEKSLQKAWKLLADGRSREVLENLVNYRISRDMAYLDGLEEENQYFPPKDEIPLLRGEEDVFLDLGAYDGDSACGFIRYAEGKYKKIIAVEASQKNYAMLVQNTAEHPRIECVNIGIYREKTQLCFEISDAKNSFVSDAGGSVLDVDSIDNLFADQAITIVKMDIEGAEYDAIIGMQKTLQQHPVLMISMYHVVEDLYRLQLLIEEFCPDVYDYYIRHYSPTVIETVLYAVPKHMRK